MWRNYMTVGVRALVKNKTYAFINIFGLAIGLAACLMLLLYVRYETGYDGWLPNAENTYQFQSHYKSKQTGEEGRLQMTSYVAGQRLKADFPQVERRVYALSSSPVVMRGGNALPTEDGVRHPVLERRHHPDDRGAARRLRRPGRRQRPDQAGCGHRAGCADRPRQDHRGLLHRRGDRRPHHAVGELLPHHPAVRRRARFVLSTSGHIAALVNPPGNPKATYHVNDDTTLDAKTWLKGADTHQGSWWADVAPWLDQRFGELAPAPKELGSLRLPPLVDAPGTYVFDN